MELSVVNEKINSYYVVNQLKNFIQEFAFIKNFIVILGFLRYCSNLSVKYPLSKL